MVDSHPHPATLHLDALIIGGGIAGLWTLDELRRRHYSCLLVEHNALGDGQTIWSQGIIHGGLKYTLAGVMNPAAEAIREMPAIWRECLAGSREPNLSAAPLRAQHCHLWQTNSLASRAGMIGARIGLRVAPIPLEKNNRPAVLRHCPGIVAQLNEQVIDPAAVLRALADRNKGFIIRAALQPSSPVPNGGGVTSLRVTEGVPPLTLHITNGAHSLTVHTRHLILTAGNGNAALRQSLNLPAHHTQTRPLRMVLVRGQSLPILNGHCVDGATTRVTITTARDAAGRAIWQVGGDLAERGPTMNPAELIALARSELAAVLPGIDLSRCDFATYDAPRAEAATRAGHRPDDAAIIEEGPILTAFPTKRALAPRLAKTIAGLLQKPTLSESPSEESDACRAVTRLLAPFDAPPIAAPPWDNTTWSSA